MAHFTSRIVSSCSYGNTDDTNWNLDNSVAASLSANKLDPALSGFSLTDSGVTIANRTVNVYDLNNINLYENTLCSASSTVTVVVLQINDYYIPEKYA